MKNPLLAFTGLPPFSAIRAEHVEPAVDFLLAQNRERLTSILSPATPRTWEGVVQPVEDMNEHLERVWGVVSHLNGVRNDPALREAYNRCLPKLSDYESELGQNRDLFEAWRKVAQERGTLDEFQQRILELEMRDFRLAGVELDEPQRSRFREIQQWLSTHESTFTDNVLDASQAWQCTVTDEARLSGLPGHAVQAARNAAEQAGIRGWLFTLDEPVYVNVMTHADDRALRREMHIAWVTRAAPGGPHPDQYDNTLLMHEILALRRELAQLLGFENYAELSLETKMAPDTGTVREFLHDLVQRSRPAGENDARMLHECAGQHGLDTLEAWDVAWLAERMRQQRYGLSQEEIRAYFPAPRVLAGMFSTVERLFGVRIRESPEPVDSWHPDVEFYEIFDGNDEVRGRFFLDLYTRKGKRGGAWMGDCNNRSRRGGQVEAPVAWLVCNFAPPSGGQPSLLTHDEVLTLFHEFGHGLHHMLTRIDYPAIAGINGVEWDAVEMPSQFLENWCWEGECMALISGHWQTGETLPGALFQRMLDARHFLAGIDMLRQLEFALFDLELHLHPDPNPAQVLQDVRAQAGVLPVAPGNRFQNSFTHVFGGGYAAGYYSYKWAEVLAADAFALFREHGVFDRNTGDRFAAAILERGGSKNAMDLFMEFRGRAPRVDALLEQYGLVA